MKSEVKFLFFGKRVYRRNKKFRGLDTMWSPEPDFKELKDPQITCVREEKWVTVMKIF